MPQAFTEEGNETFGRRNIIGLCVDSLKSVPDWDYVIQPRIAEGNKLELAWRVDAKLDWVWQDMCVDGTQRHWAVLCGLTLKQVGFVHVTFLRGECGRIDAHWIRLQKSCTPHLELRLGAHFPTSVLMSDGTQLQEPPAIEGYLDRIKPNSQAKQPTYLATHDGNLFCLSPALAHPPSPPGLYATRNNTTENPPTLRQAEVRRGALQILDANGVSDLRDILAVRRAFQIVPPTSHDEAGNRGDDSWARIWTASRPESSDSDDEDQGGDDGFAAGQDKPRLRMKRAFELLLKNGHLVRFEVREVLNDGFLLTMVLRRPIRVASLLSGLSAYELSLYIGGNAI
jgi:hypothetical protein